MIFNGNNHQLIDNLEAFNNLFQKLSIHSISTLMKHFKSRKGLGWVPPVNNRYVDVAEGDCGVGCVKKIKEYFFIKIMKRCSLTIRQKKKQISNILAICSAFGYFILFVLYIFSTNLSFFANFANLLTIYRFFLDGSIAPTNKKYIAEPTQKMLHSPLN